MAFKIVDIFAEFFAKDSNFTATVDKAHGSVNKLGGGIQTAHTRMLAMWGAIAGLGYEFYRLVHHAGMAEETIDRLKATMSTMGPVTEDGVNDIKKFALGLQNITTLTDEAVMETMRLGMTIGHLSGQELKDGTKAAIGLSKAYNLDLEAAMRLVSKAHEGITLGFRRLGIQIDSTMTKEEAFNKVLQLGAAGFKTATAEAEGFEGRLKQAKNEFGEFEEIAGKAFTKTSWISGWTNGLKSINAEFRAVDEGAQSLGSALIRITEGVIGGAGALFGLDSGKLTAMRGRKETTKDWNLHNNPADEDVTTTAPMPVPLTEDEQKEADAAKKVKEKLAEDLKKIEFEISQDEHSEVEQRIAVIKQEADRRLKILDDSLAAGLVEQGDYYDQVAHLQEAADRQTTRAKDEDAKRTKDAKDRVLKEASEEADRIQRLDEDRQKMLSEFSSDRIAADKGEAAGKIASLEEWYRETLKAAKEIGVSEEDVAKEFNLKADDVIGNIDTQISNLEKQLSAVSIIGGPEDIITHIQTSIGDDKQEQIAILRDQRTAALQQLELTKDSNAQLKKIAGKPAGVRIG